MYYWQLKTQRPRETVRWSAHNVRDDIARGLTANGDAMIFFFRTKLAASNAVTVLKSESQNRGMRLYLRRVKHSDIECNSSALG